MQRSGIASKIPGDPTLDQKRPTRSQEGANWSKTNQLLEAETIEKDQLLEEFENMVDELTKEGEEKDKVLAELKMRLADLEHERDRVKSAKEELSKRFLVGS